LPQLARDGTERAINLIMETIDDASEDRALRVQAASVLLKLGWGSAPKLPSITLNVGDSVSAMLTTEQLVALATGREPIDVEPE
jgi:hypothetical protein